MHTYIMDMPRMHTCITHASHMHHTCITHASHMHHTSITHGTRHMHHTCIAHACAGEAPQVVAPHATESQGRGRPGQGERTDDLQERTRL